MKDRLKHFQLDDEYELIVETNPIHQPHLQADAYFAGIWPKEKGPTAKTWLRADSPAQAFRMGQEWAETAMAEVKEKMTE